jgi:hypothetical protein
MDLLAFAAAERCARAVNPALTQQQDFDCRLHKLIDSTPLQSFTFYCAPVF